LSRPVARANTASDPIPIYLQITPTGALVFRTPHHVGNTRLWTAAGSAIGERVDCAQFKRECLRLRRNFVHADSDSGVLTTGFLFLRELVDELRQSGFDVLHSSADRTASGSYTNARRLISMKFCALAPPGMESWRRSSHTLLPTTSLVLADVSISASKREGIKGMP
jgi:hypothetical protein